MGGGQIHAINITPPSRAISVVIHPHLCGEDCMYYFSNKIVFDSVYKHSDPVGDAIIKNIVRLVSTMESKLPGYELRVKSLVSDSFALLVENQRYSYREIQSTNEIMTELIEIVRKEYHGNISLGLLAERTNYSKQYIIGLFKHHTGKTSIDYVNTHEFAVLELRIHK